jgi:hypothetical protein
MSKYKIINLCEDLYYLFLEVLLSREILFLEVLFLEVLFFEVLLSREVLFLEEVGYLKLEQIA